jgi:cytochrome P450
VTSEGDFWLRQRRRSQPAVLKSRVLSYAPAMAAITRTMLAGWRPGQTVDVHDEFSAVTSAIALKTLFGLDDAGDRAEFVDRLRLAFDLLSDRFRDLVRLPMWVPTPRTCTAWWTGSSPPGGRGRSRATTCWRGWSRPRTTTARG